MAKVDAEAEESKATAKSHGITSYPTIKFFPKGSSVGQLYEGGRTEAAFIEFINEKAGTHRTVGGGLDAQAGTIDALDAVVAKLSAGGSISTVLGEISNAASSLKSKYAEYYVKVATKMSESQGYVEKELKRLESILGKGGLAPAKKDDITSRTNILKKFTGKEAGKDEL